MGRVSREEFVLDQCHIQLTNNMLNAFAMPWLQQTRVHCDNQRGGEIVFFRSTINATCV